MKAFVLQLWNGIWQNTRKIYLNWTVCCVVNYDVSLKRFWAAFYSTKFQRVLRIKNTFWSLTRIMMLLYTHLKLKLGYLRKKLIRICYPAIKVAHLVIREATVMKKKTDKFSNQKLISIQVIKIDKCEESSTILDMTLITWRRPRRPCQVKECKMSPKQRLLTGWLSLYKWCRLRFQFYFLRTSSRQADFLCAAAQLCKIGRVPVNYLVLDFYPCLKST